MPFSARWWRLFRAFLAVQRFRWFRRRRRKLPPSARTSAALIFLITGPATDAATLTTLWQIIGKKQLAGFLMNAIGPRPGIAEQVCHAEGHGGPLDLLWVALLVAVLVKGMWPKREK